MSHHKQIKELLEENFGIDELDNDTPIFSSGLLDSMDVLRLMQLLEETFKIKIPAFDVTIEMFNTINGIDTIINSKS